LRANFHFLYEEKPRFGLESISIQFILFDEFQELQEEFVGFVSLGILFFFNSKDTSYTSNISKPNSLRFNMV